MAAGEQSRWGRAGWALGALGALALLGCFLAGAGAAPAAGAAALLVLAAARPDLALALLAASLPLMVAAPGAPRLEWLDVQVLALVAGFGLRTAAGRERAAPSRLDMAVLAWTGVALASLLPPRWHPPSAAPADLAALVRHLFQASDTGPWETWRAGFDTASAAALFCITAAVVRTRGAATLRRALVLAVGGAALAGLAERAGLLSLRALRPIHPLYPDRLHSFAHHPAWLAELLLLALPWLVEGDGRLGRGERRLAVAAALGGALAVVLTLQRGAWIALLAAAGTAVWVERARLLRSRRSRLAAAGAVVLLAVLPAALVPAVRARAGVLFADLSNRSLFLKPVLGMTGERPFLGQGLGSFAWHYPEVVPPGDPQHLVFHGEAHSAYLMVLAERGSLGLLTWLGLLAAVGWTAHRAGSRAGLLTAVVLAVYGLGQYLFYVRAVELAAWIGLGLLAGAAPAPPAGRRRRMGLAAVALACAALAVGRALGPAFPPAPGDRTFGLHRVEASAGRNFRWTAERADLALDGGPGAGVLEVELADGMPGRSPGPLAVELVVDGAALARVVPPRGEFRPYRYWIGAGRTPRVVSLRPSRTFRPADLGETPDTRRLGVAVRGPRLRPPRPGELFGLSGVEEEDGIYYRWSLGRRGAVAVGDRGGTLVLPVRAADPGARERPVVLRVAVAGGASRDFRLADREWHEIEVPLAAGGGPTVVELEVDRTWSPGRAGLGDDVRELGFALAAWKVRP